MKGQGYRPTTAKQTSMIAGVVKQTLSVEEASDLIEQLLKVQHARKSGLTAQALFNVEWSKPDESEIT